MVTFWDSSALVPLFIDEPATRLREAALILLRKHPLRAADALQLAAADIAGDRNPSMVRFVCLDDRLAGAARREGFTVIGREESGSSVG